MFNIVLLIRSYFISFSLMFFLLLTSCIDDYSFSSIICRKQQSILNGMDTYCQSGIFFSLFCCTLRIAYLSETGGRKHKYSYIHTGKFFFRLTMNEIHPPLSSSKMPSARLRLPFSEAPPVSMIKLERGLVQRSLLYCLERGYFSLIRYLLESGSANVRERDSEGRTGLIYCCFIDNDCWAQNIAMILIEHGAKIEDHDQRGLNALHYAIITQRAILVRRYLDSLDFDLSHSTDIHGNTCLHYACSIGNIEILRYILNAMKHYSIDLTTKNRSGLTAYDVACQLNFDRCQNLLRNEMTLEERNNPSVRTPIDSITERRLSTAARRRSTTSTTSSYCESVASLPFFVSSSLNLRKRRQSTLSYNNENALTTRAKFIDPIESRIIALKRNPCLDTSLVNQAKNRSDFAPTSLTSQSAVFSSSSPPTWREDVSKMFDHLQTFKTSSYRKSIDPPLSNELSCELFERLYGMGGADGHNCSSHRPLSSTRRTNSSQKIIHRRRSSGTSGKSMNTK